MTTRTCRVVRTQKAEPPKAPTLIIVTTPTKIVDKEADAKRMSEAEAIAEANAKALIEEEAVLSRSRAEPKKTGKKPKKGHRKVRATSACAVKQPPPVDNVEDVRIAPSRPDWNHTLLEVLKEMKIDSAYAEGFLSCDCKEEMEAAIDAIVMKMSLVENSTLDPDATVFIPSRPQ